MKKQQHYNYSPDSWQSSNSANHCECCSALNPTHSLDGDKLCYSCYLSLTQD